jgi:hypothetical protein
MPNGYQFDAERFAALMASFDTANPSEAEAINAARVLRRMVAGNNLRVVDALERPDVKAALDARLQPVRQETANAAALEAAQKEAEDLRGRLAVVVPKLTEISDALTESLRRERELMARLRGQSAPRQHGSATPAGMPQPAGQSLFLPAAAVVVAAVLLLMAAFRGNSSERSQGNGLGTTERNNAPLVRKGRATVSSAKSRSLHSRLHRVGPSGQRR